ncbi:MAG: excisionase family DNA-binding protein [Methyloligellaceae bacterium]
MPFLTTSEAADYLNVTNSYIEKLITTKALPTPITMSSLEQIKKENHVLSITARKKLREIIRHYDMGY